MWIRTKSEIVEQINRVRVRILARNIRAKFNDAQPDKQVPEPPSPPPPPRK